MNSIGPHFFALAFTEQANRIEAFTQAILDGNPRISARSLATALRKALASMTERSTFPVAIDVRGHILEISGREFSLTLRLNSSTGN